MKKGKNLVIFSFVCALVTSACLLLSVSAEEGEEGATEIIEYYEEPSDSGSYIEDVPQYFGGTEEFTTEVFGDYDPGYEGGDEPIYIPEENGGVEYVPEYVPEIPSESGDSSYVTDTTEVSGNYAQDGPVDNEQYYQQFVNPDYVPEHSSSQNSYVSGEVSVNYSDSTTNTTSNASTTYSSGTYSGMSIVREDPGPDYEYYASGALTALDGEETDYSYKLDNNGYCIVYYGKPIETVKSGILDEYKNFVQKIIIEEGNKEFTYEGNFTDFNVLEEVQLPASIGNTRNLFENCINLRKVTFFGGTTYDASNEPLTLGDKAFKNCISLQEVILPEDRDVYFENSVFANCIELETITLPEHFMGGGEDIFKGCSALKSIDLPANVSRIKNGSFEECTALTTMSVYANLQAVEVNAFKHTDQLKNICVKDLTGKVDTITRILQSGGVAETVKIGHDFGEGKEISAPSINGPGVVEYTCSVCGATETHENYLTDKKVNLFYFKCPVDVEVFNSKGTLVAQTIGEDVVYKEANPSVFAEVINSEKYVLSYKNEGLSFRVTGTGNGTMSTGVQSYESDGVIGGAIASYENIDITPGKMFDVKFNADGLDIAVVDAYGNVISKINNNGNEKVYIDSVSVSQSSYEYDGNEKLPPVTVKGANGELLLLDTDYTVEYSNNISVGTASVKVTGIGKYMGEKSASFTITEATQAPVYVETETTVTPSSYDTSANTYTPTTNNTSSNTSSSTSNNTSSSTTTKTSKATSSNTSSSTSTKKTTDSSSTSSKNTTTTSKNTSSTSTSNKTNTSTTNKTDSSTSNKTNTSTTNKTDSSTSNKTNTSTTNKTDSSTSSKSNTSTTNKTDSSTSNKSNTSTTNKTDSSTSNKTTTDSKTDNKSTSSTTTNKVDSSTSNKTSADTKSDSTTSDKEKTSNVIRVDNNNTSEKKDANKTSEKVDADKTSEKVDADKTSDKKDADKTNEKVDSNKTDEKKDDKVSEEKVEPKVEEEVEPEVAPALAPTDSLKQFKIEYDLDGGINNPSNPSGYDKDEIFALFAPSKSGYKFMGWDEGSDDAGNKKFKAKWEVIDYPIEYVLDGGQNAPENPTTYTVDDRIELKDPTKLGYEFDGWVEGSVIDLGSTGEKKFTAQWKDAGKFSTPLLKLVNNSNMMSTISVALLGVMILGWLLLGLRGF